MTIIPYCDIFISKGLNKLKEELKVGNSSQELIKMVGGKDKFEKKYRQFSPLVLNYIDAVEDVFGEVPLQVLLNVAKSKIRVKNGADFSGVNYYFPDYSELSQSNNSIKLFTEISQKNINLSFTNQDIENIAKKDDSKSEKGKKIQWLRVEVLLHELTHSAFKTEFVLHQANGGIKVEGKISPDELKNAAIYGLKGGLTLYKYEFDEFGKFKGAHQYRENALLHEGATEYIALKLFKNKAFKNIYNIADKSEAPLNISYKPIYMYVAMCDALYNGVISKSFYKKELGILDSQAIQDIRKIFNPMVAKIVDAENLSIKDNDIATMNTKVHSLFMEIKKCCTEMQNLAKEKIKANRLSKSNLKDFVDNYNNFIKFDSWDWFLRNKLNLNELDKEYFLEALKMEMVGIKPINEKEFLDVKVKSLFQRYQQKIREIKENEK